MWWPMAVISAHGTLRQELFLRWLSKWGNTHSLTGCPFLSSRLLWPRAPQGLPRLCGFLFFSSAGFAPL